MKKKHKPQFGMLCEADSRKCSKDILLRIAHRQIIELVDHYEHGFSAFQPNIESMENIKRCANQLWQVMDGTDFIKVERNTESMESNKRCANELWKVMYARSDTKFQDFLKSLNS